MFTFSGVQVPFYERFTTNQWIVDPAHIILLSVIVCTIEVFFHTAFGWAFHILKRAWTCWRLASFAHFCVYTGCTSPRAGRRVSPREIEAGGLGSRRNKRNGSPRVEKKSAKRGGHMKSQSCHETILSILHESYYYCDDLLCQTSPSSVNAMFG